ncbi:hypothetical protein NLJ89_g7668 [Agrocybe chaxingu]|uniref:Piwi domain-containing protein n=1 Tax=Agrocybe chaxingu TaxID=84603 RepID=A0A9W8JWR0_9AGAR|nr:hypothetical protein NLJ89_g7668 [Agrocybe chaxingu]
MAGYTQRSRPLEIETNAFEIRIPENGSTYLQYDNIRELSDATPRGREPGLPRNKKIKLFHHLQNVVAASLFSSRMVYDGQSIAYSPERIRFPGGHGAGGSFIIHLNQPSIVSSGTRGAYEIRLTPTVGDEISFQKHRTNNGRAYFSGAPRTTRSTPRGVELWQGIFISVRPTIGKMILTMDTTVAAVFKHGHLVTLCLEYLKLKNVNQLILRQNSSDYKRLEKFLLNLRIVIQTNGTRSRPKTIRGLIENGGEFMFLKNDEEISVARHFQQAHNVRIQNPRIVGICLSGKKSERKEVVPLELCIVEPGQLCKRIPEDIRTDMVRFSTMRPGERREKIMTEIHSYVTSEYLRESGLQVNPEPLTIRSKMLDSPGIIFQQETLNPQDGKWNVLRRRLQNPSALTSWGVVNFISNSLDMKTCTDMMLELADCCKNLGMAVGRPVGIDPGQPHTLTKALDLMVEKAKRAGVDGSRFIIIVILPQDAGPLRTQIKHWGDIINGIPTQCLREHKLLNPRDPKFRPPDSQYWNNVALNPGVQKPSVSSLVYSHDEHATEYAALTSIQAPRLEMIQDLSRFIKMALENFVAKNNTPPNRLIFFRDGVSEGEYQRVAEQELVWIRDGINALWLEKGVLGKIPPPMITFIIVTKRHHAVFFPKRGVMQDRTGNLQPGCVVDSTITSPDGTIKDFYLQSHAAIQGTCRSSHYIVLHDEIFNNDLNKMQDLAYTLCHVYAKATRIVSIPAPVYYADLVCQRSAFHMDPHGPLSMDDDTTSTLHSGPAPFDLSMWQQAWRPTNPRLDKRMYFL